MLRRLSAAYSLSGSTVAVFNRRGEAVEHAREESFRLPERRGPPTLSRSETRSRGVSWGFAAGSVAWLAPSWGAAVAALPVGWVLVRPAGGAGPLWPVLPEVLLHPS